MNCSKFEKRLKDVKLYITINPFQRNDIKDTKNKK